MSDAQKNNRAGWREYQKNKREQKIAEARKEDEARFTQSFMELLQLTGISGDENVLSLLDFVVGNAEEIGKKPYEACDAFCELHKSGIITLRQDNGVIVIETDPILNHPEVRKLL